MSIRYTLRHNIPADKLAAEDVNDSSTWDLDLLRKHELAETDNHDIVYRKHDGEVVNWAEAATQQAQAILEEVQGISGQIDEQVQIVEAQLEDVTQAAATLTEEAEAANEAAQQAVIEAEAAVDSSSANATQAQTSSNLSRDWATKTDGKVDNEDYSSKYYAGLAATSESNASSSATNAQSSASTAVSAKNDAVSAKNTAQTAATSATASATTATTKAGEAADSAATASTKASEASTSATNAATSATSAANSATAASGSATSAAASETNAGLSATSAATSATSAAASATDAATSETNAATSASDAEDAKDVAEAARDEILDMRDYYGLPIGYEYFTTNPNIPQGSLPLFGGEYSRETYSALWDWVQTQTGYLITESAWTALSNSQNGNVPYYSDGDGSTTFRVPSLKCWVRGANGTVSEVGSYLEAGLPNITGTVNFFTGAESGYQYTLRTGNKTGGAFYENPTTGSSVSKDLRPTTSITDKMGAAFDASRSSSIYGNSTTVQPESIVGLWLVKAYGVIVDTGTIDEQQYIDDRFAAAKDYTDMEVETGVPTGCVQAFAGQTTPTGWLLCDGSAVSRTTYAKLFSVIGTSYGSGDGSTTFNLPNLVDKFVEGSATSGTVKSAGLPNITGSVNSEYIISNNYSGALTYKDSGTSRYGSTTTTWHNGIGFDASKSNSIYGNSNTVQPPALTMRYIIKY